MSIKSLINKSLIASDALLRGWRGKKNSSGKKVLVILQQIFGDAVVISDSLMEYPKIFKNEEVIFVARPAVIKFLKELMPHADELNFEAVDFKKFIEDFGYYREISKKFRGIAEILIVPVSTPSAEIFSCSNDAKRKIASVRPTDIKSSFLMSALSKFSYTEKIRPDKNEKTLQRHRQLLHYLGDKDFKAKVPRLNSEARFINEEKYCIVCAGASKTEKCWPVERFAKIIDFVNENYNMNVHLCGGAEDIKIGEELEKLVKYPEKLINHIAKTNFKQWSSLIQYADLVVANDSATVHLAAAHRVKTVCILGVHELVILPYKVDVLQEGDRLPLCVYKQLPCEYCVDKLYFAGSLNAECKKRIDENKCALCIDAVTVEDIKEAVTKIMKEG